MRRSALISLGGSSSQNLAIFGLSAFVKFVNNMTTKGVGFFVEPSVGVQIFDLGQSVEIAQALVWGGLHAFVADNIAIIAGPYAGILAPLTENADTIFTFGLRFGISAYIL